MEVKFRQQRILWRTVKVRRLERKPVKEIFVMKAGAMTILSMS